MNYPLSKYRYYQRIKNGVPEVIAISTYGGKTVRGRAKCDPHDHFDLETGKRLAAARCALKVAEKRAARATHCVSVAEEQVRFATQKHLDMIHYYEDSINEVANARNTIEDIMRELRDGE